jgi:probable phosphoglycerate mutase
MAAAIAEAFGRAAEAGATIGEEGESFAAALTRSSAAFTDLLARPDWVRMLIVAHEGINRVLLSWACGAGLRAAGAFEQDTGCINVLDVDMDGNGRAKRIIVKAVNLTPWDYTKHGMNRTSLEAIFAVE